MKWAKKYDHLNLDEIYNEHKQGISIPDLCKKYKLPTTTLRRYLNEKGHKLFYYNYNTTKTRNALRKKLEDNPEYDYKTSEKWKRALLEKYTYSCFVCGYDKLLEAHHIIPTSTGGKNTVLNGILLCPNHHAEVHAGILTVALLKQGELLGNPLDNQQASHISNEIIIMRGMEAPETNGQAKAVMPTRAPCNTSKIDRVDDIVRTVGTTYRKQDKEPADNKTYGFITMEDGKDVFAHYSEIKTEGYKSLAEGDEVQCGTEETDKGLKATNIEKI